MFRFGSGGPGKTLLFLNQEGVLTQKRENTEAGSSVGFCSSSGSDYSLIQLTSVKGIGAWEMKVEREKCHCSRPPKSWNTAERLRVNNSFAGGGGRAVKPLHKSLTRWEEHKEIEIPSPEHKLYSI